jgi:hypothetical protein
MHAPYGRPFRDPMWIAGAAIVALTASGAFAIVRGIPPSIASHEEGGGAAARAASIVSAGAGDAQAQEARIAVAVAPSSTNRLRRMPCSECAVVASIRRVDRPVQVDGNHNVGLATVLAVDARTAASAVPGATESGASYEVTVRFRDGSTAIFIEERLPNVRPGRRVVVIGGADAAGH